MKTNLSDIIWTIGAIVRSTVTAYETEFRAQAIRATVRKEIRTSFATMMRERFPKLK